MFLSGRIRVRASQSLLPLSASVGQLLPSSYAHLVAKGMADHQLSAATNSLELSDKDTLTRGSSK